jgi:hypothetical protein
MSLWRAVLIAITMVGVAGVGPSAGVAQTRPSSKTQDRMMGGQDIEGRIRDVGNERITLEDGTVLMVPKGMVKQSELKTGATVKAKYQDRNGQKVATMIQINPAAESGTGAGSK